MGLYGKRWMINPGLLSLETGQVVTTKVQNHEKSRKP